MPAVPITRRTQHLGLADVVEISGGEDGFELYVGTMDGARFVVNVHAVLGQLLEEVTREITAYLAEGEEARRTRPVTDDADAYPADDPKHPNWHSVHVDHYDSREGK